MPKRWILATGLLLGLFLPHHAGAQVTDEEVQAGIRRLVERIYNSQNEDGHWEPGPHGRAGIHYGGLTAINTFALLTAGESYQNPRLRPAIEFLKDIEMSGTYAVSLRAHVWAALPPRFQRYLRRDVQWLLRAAHPIDASQGTAWHYQIGQTTYDNSTSQYGLLGIWEGAKRGIPVPNSLWGGVERHFLNTQHNDGGWDYRGGNARASMTTAGLAALFVIRDQLRASEYRRVGQSNDHPLQQRIDRGMAWLSDNFVPGRNVQAGGGDAGFAHYYMYGVERVAMAGGYKYLNNVDWYASGARWLLDNPGRDSDAAFSLLFLVRGRVPVFVNKLEVPGRHWNNRPSDAANVTRWVSDESQREMLWQVVPIDQNPQDWLDAPILYLASHEPLNLDSRRKAAIKRYIDLGGMLITTADSDSREFTNSVRDLLGELYPDYEYRRLDEDDELMDVVFQLTPNRFEAWTVHNGVRHLAVHLPQDVSWDLHARNHENPRPWQFFMNAYFYATEKGRNRYRLEHHFLARSGRGGGSPITIGRARHHGNWDPEPLAWEVQANAMHNEAKGELRVRTVALDDLPDPSQVPFVHVTGTDELEFSEAQVAAVRDYTGAGGVILFENAGGRGDFSRSVAAMLQDAYPGERLRPIRPDAPLITGEGFGGYDASSVEYRPFTLLRMGRVDTPRIEGLNVDGEPRILVSGEDLSVAMLNQPVWGVLGYSPESAQRLMTNAIRWADNNAPSNEVSEQ